MHYPLGSGDHLSRGANLSLWLWATRNNVCVIPHQSMSSYGNIHKIECIFVRKSG